MSLLFLVNLLGWIPLLAGCATWGLTMPINVYFSKLYQKAQEKVMKIRDQKLGVVNEALGGIRQIKLSALESQWEKRILGIREKELKAIWRVCIGDTALFGCWIISPLVLSAMALSVYAWMNGELKPSVAFGKLVVVRRSDVD